MPELYATDFYVDSSEVCEALKEPDNFCYSGNKDLFKTWSLGPCTGGRDSDDLALQCNVRVLRERLRGHRDWAEIYCSHWGHGYVKHMTFRVVENDLKTVTPVAKIILEWAHEVREYCVLDESAYYAAQHEGLVENIKDIACNIADDAPEDWADQVAEWLRHHYPEECDVQHDGSAAYPHTTKVQAALKALDLLDEDT